MSKMSKKVLIIVSAIIIFTIATFFVFFAEEDPLVVRAKEEAHQAQLVLDSFQNAVNAIPVLELSRDIKMISKFKQII